MSGKRFSLRILLPLVAFAGIGLVFLMQQIQRVREVVRNAKPASHIYYDLGAVRLVAMDAAPISSAAGNWPQILGPHRNGVADGEKLADHWLEGEPKTLWQRKVGRGFAGAAIRAGRVVLFHREEDEEIVEALDLATGKRLWRTPFKARYKGDIFPDEDGPLCVPLVYGDRVIVYGAGGDLHVLSFSDGKPQWSRALYEEFHRRGDHIDFGYFGAGSSPIVVGDRVLVNVGGHGSGIVALALDNGRTLWKGTDEDASYSSPLATVLGTRPCIVFVTRLNCLGIDPADGTVRFRFAFGQRGPTVNAASPVIAGDRLFVSSCYGVGAVLSRLDADGAHKVWASEEVLSNHYNTSIEVGGYLYGVDGRADTGTPSLRCVEFSAGKRVWSQPGFGAASLLLADGKLVILKVDGELLLALPSPKGFRRLAGAKVLDEPVRALPAISDGHLVVRDATTLKCLLLPKR